MTLPSDTSLNEQQRLAVSHGEGALLVLAGPGSGKTRVVTARIAQLLEDGVPSNRLLALTFTNKAASEMAERAAVASGGQYVWVSTFHRFCSRLLRQYSSLVGLNERFTIYDTDDSISLLKSILNEADVETARYTPRQISQAISRAKNELLHPEDLQTSHRPIDAVVAEVYPLYQQRLIAANAVDFDDLLLHVVRMLHESDELRRTLDDRFRYILVDEYQDTNLAQYAIVRGLSIDYPNLTVTGDPDQSIYAWRGANIQNILRFEQDYPGASVVRLEQNYRSTKRILTVADTLILANKQRKSKSLWTENPAGHSVRLVEYDSGRTEAEGIVDRIANAVDGGESRPRDFAILYRTNALSRALEHAFRARGIPYQIVRGIEFYRRKEIKDILAYLQLTSNSRDEIALLRIINAPPRGIGKVTLGKLRSYSLAHNQTLSQSIRDAQFRSTLSKRAAKSIESLARQLDKMMACTSSNVETLVNEVLDVSGYRQHLQDSDHEEDRQRLANVEELCTAAKEYDATHGEGGHLEGFLEQVALVNETDDWAEDSDRVTLLTMHAAKGMEFPFVFIIAVEDGILPHERSREDVEQLEEERRLLFVGVTRAKISLQISYSRARDFRGRLRRCVPSFFLMDIRDTVEFHREEALTWPTENELAEFASAQLRPNKSPRTPSSPPRLVTAAELLGETPHENTGDSMEQVTLGALVMHPVHGPGKVIDVSGSGKRKTVAVQFIQSAQQRKFRVAFSPLRPMHASEQ